MWSFFIWFTAAERSFVIWYVPMLLDLHQPLEFQHVEINMTHLQENILTTKAFFFNKSKSNIQLFQIILNCILCHLSKEFLSD